MMQNSLRRYKCSILAGLMLAVLSPLVLSQQGEGPTRLVVWLTAVLTGTAGGYLLDQLFRHWRITVSLQRRSVGPQNGEASRAALAAAWHQAVADRSPSILLLVHTASGRIVEATSAASRFYGYPLERLRTMALSDLTADKNPAIAEGDNLAGAPPQSQPATRHLLASGTTMRVEIASQALAVGGCPHSLLAVKAAGFTPLQPIIPICSHCKKIRDQRGNWYEMEEYLQQHLGAALSHGICSGCAQQFYPSVYRQITLKHLG